MEFKITHETTLYQLQEYCKKQVDCSVCKFREDTEAGCRFVDMVPVNWELPKPKTYKEDFLKKFPNAVIRDQGMPASCRALIYDGAIYCTNRESNCNKCWNQLMEEENE